VQLRAHASARAAFASQTSGSVNLNYPITMLLRVELAS
jgi:hypothetical protein